MVPGPGKAGNCRRGAVRTAGRSSGRRGGGRCPPAGGRWAERSRGARSKLDIQRRAQRARAWGTTKHLVWAVPRIRRCRKPKKLQATRAGQSPGPRRSLARVPPRCPAARGPRGRRGRRARGWRGAWLPGGDPSKTIAVHFGYRRMGCPSRRRALSNPRRRPQPLAPAVPIGHGRPPPPPPRRCRRAVPCASGSGRRGAPAPAGASRRSDYSASRKRRRGPAHRDAESNPQEEEHVVHNVPPREGLARWAGRCPSIWRRR
mmetsp:Transcript_14471/g.36602  ORF Transcript_14471/g.36602 Transcript_14471/m.36602 type:complete len:260 (-) Transcript_14471:217-996(-)